jgi:hypothetical protein
MNNRLKYVLIGAGGMLYTFLVWNTGFTQGADVALCVTQHVVSEKPMNEVEACGRVRDKSPFFFIRSNLPEALK